MNPSIYLAAITLTVFLIAATGAWLVGRRTAGRRQRRSIYLKTFLILVIGIAMAAFAFWTDSDQRQTTLFEEILVGSPAETVRGGEVIRRVTFNVEHADVPHQLMIGPMFQTPTMQRAHFEVDIAVRLARASDTPLVDESLHFRPRHSDNKWLASHLTFTPHHEGPHTISLRFLTPGTPAVHVRVADPLKTDGERAPGY